ncbi:MAG: DUF4249 domain-containing protein [Reichenbachiella sp.]|uniref:DUF4249 domain-containing protein n=1 Tax=Reichenbachiella sp. TaxID=2184521 RepID=UPI003297F909
MRNIIVIILLLALIGCVEPYDFGVTETVEVMVIDAQLTNEQKAHRVELSLSRAIDSESPSKVAGAEVRFIEDGNTEINLIETEAGVYETASTISGKSGSSYVLSITLANGTTYQSTPQVLAAPVAIDSVYGKYLELPSEENGEVLKGMQFFIDTHDETSEVSYFRYEYLEDFEIKVPYPSGIEWYPSTQTYGPRAEDIGTCYGNGQNQSLIIASTSGLSENRLSEFPIQMVSVDDPQLEHRYALTVRQYMLSASAYQYYKNLLENNESSGSFFDKQKGTIAGNIFNQNNPAEPVLGFFEVAGVSSVTDFFISSDFRSQGFISNYDLRNCNPQTAVDTVQINTLNNELMSAYNIVEFPVTVPNGAIIVLVPCSDCRIYADNKKPDYWD